MEQKIVSFEVAKAIKDAGYPQGYTSQCYLTSDHNQFYHKGQIVDEVDEWRSLTVHLADIPTYLDVWLWLWREKRIWLQVRHMGNGNWFKCWAVTGQNFSDPEEAVVSAIEYLVDRNLIK